MKNYTDKQIEEYRAKLGKLLFRSAFLVGIIKDYDTELKKVNEEIGEIVNEIQGVKEDGETVQCEK